jgi:hypothetical protein
MSDWIRRTAHADILDEDFDLIVDDALYRNMDRLHPARMAFDQNIKQIKDRGYHYIVATRQSECNEMFGAGTS